MNHRIARVMLVAVLIALGDVRGALAQDKQSVTLAIDKMFCVLCGNSVKKSLSKVAGVEEVQVDVKKKIAVVRFDATKATVADLTSATAKAGFPAIAQTPAQ